MTPFLATKGQRARKRGKNCASAGHFVPFCCCPFVFHAACRQAPAGGCIGAMEGFMVVGWLALSARIRRDFLGLPGCKPAAAGRRSHLVLARHGALCTFTLRQVERPVKQKMSFYITVRPAPCGRRRRFRAEPPGFASKLCPAGRRPIQKRKGRKAEDRLATKGHKEHKK